MRKLLIAASLTLALLGAMSVGVARPLSNVHMSAAHALMWASGGATPYTPVCPGGGSTTCG